MERVPLDLYYVMENDLQVLVGHYEIRRGARPDEVLDWAKFFLQWSRKATVHRAAWSLENLAKAEQVVRDLSAPQPGFKAFEALQAVMAEAGRSIHVQMMEGPWN